MEKIPISKYPGPPPESTSFVRKKACTPWPAPEKHQTTQYPGPQHYRSLPTENIPAPPYPGPPLESQSTNVVQQRAFAQQPVPQTQQTTAEMQGGPSINQQFYGPQHQRSLPTENIPAPPYPGPPLDSQPTSFVQQSAFTQQPAPQSYQITAEGGPRSNQQFHDPQHHRSLPTENIPAPPYPGPPLESQSTSVLQQRAFTHQPVPQTQQTTAEMQGGPSMNQQSRGPQHQRYLPTENISGPPYFGPQLNTQATSTVQQRAFTQQPTLQANHTNVESVLFNNQQSHGPLHQRYLPTENIPGPQYSGPPLDHQGSSSVQQRAFTQQPTPQTHQPNAEGYMRSNATEHYSSLPRENIPVPPYRGSPLDSQNTSSVQHRTFTHQPTAHQYQNLLEGGPHTRLHSLGPQRQSSLPMENMPVHQSTSSLQQRGYTQQPAPHIHRTIEQGGSCQQMYSDGNPTFYPQHTKHSPACTEKEKISPTVYEECLEIRMNSRTPDKVFAQQDQYKPYAQGIHSSPDFTNKRSVDSSTERHFSMDKMSASRHHSTTLEEKAELLRISEKHITEVSRHTTENVQLGAHSESPPLYSGPDLTLQSPNVVKVIPDTSASMYTQIYGASSVQPGVQVVQSGGAQVVIQQQRPAVVVRTGASHTIIQSAASQPAVVIQPAAPAVRIIQPQVLPTVIQPASTVVYRSYY